MRCYFEKPRTSIGLEGADHGPAPRRLGRHSRGAAHRPPLPPRRDRSGRAHGHGAVGPDHSAVHRRPDLLVGHRRPHHRIADPPPDGFRTVDAVGIQETPRRAPIAPAINAIQAARQPQTFLGISGDGVASAVSTTGNPNCHLVLRGGDSRAELLRGARGRGRAAVGRRRGCERAIVIDCSHGNSGKEPDRQPEVLRNVVAQRVCGGRFDRRSHAGEQPGGRQSAVSSARPDSLVYGQSITDACLDWETTERLVLETAERW